ncbi:hypothetical protein [Alteromonas sediminis]|nr:hypothetical protein [Alteromonas sediminis]
MNKKNTDDLQSQFKQQEGPNIIGTEWGEQSVLLSLNVPADLSWFDGHFPTHKVLPGVVQIDWAGKLAKALFQGASTFSQLSNIKFKSMVMPNTDLSLLLEWDKNKGNVKFHYFNQDESFSTGIVKFLPQ